MKTHPAYDPNSHLDAEIIERGVLEARKALAATGIPWQRADHPESNSMIWAYINYYWHIIYVRVTTDDVDFTGVGELPQILMESCKKMHSKYRAVVRVHFEADGTVRLIGFQNVIPKLQFEAGAWNKKLLGGRTALDYLKMSGGKPAVLTVNLVYEKPPSAEEWIEKVRWNYRNPNPDEVENPLLADLLPDIEEENLSEEEYVKRALAEKKNNPTRGDFHIQLAVERLPLRSFPVSMGELLDSTTWNSKWGIYTCECGSVMCAGLKHEVSVVHESGLTVWRVYGPKPSRIIVFDQQQYRAEILAKIREALNFHQTLPAHVWFGEVYCNKGRDVQRKWVERALASAEKFVR